MDYLGSIIGQTYTNMLPLLMLTVLGAAANASFYVAYTIAWGLNTVSANFATSLLVEGAAAPGKLGKLTRGLLARTLLVTVAGAAVLALGGRLLLTVYGHGYAANAALVLTLLALGTIPQGLLGLTYSLDRLAGRVGRSGLSRAALAVMVLGGSWVLLDRRGSFAPSDGPEVVTTRVRPHRARRRRQRRGGSLLVVRSSCACEYW